MEFDFDPRSERESAAQLAALIEEWKPIGPTELAFVLEINFHSQRHDVQKLKVAVFALKKVQWLRTQTDAAAIQQALAEH